MYAEFAFLVLFLIPGPFSFGLFCDTIIFNGCAFMALLSHFRAMTTGKYKGLSQKDKTYAALKEAEFHKLSNELKKSDKKIVQLAQILRQGGAFL